MFNSFIFFFFNDTATTEIYPLSLHDALPISPSSPLAHTTATSATEPLVIQSLVPLSTYSLPFLRARVAMEPGSDPWSGSVRPKQPRLPPDCSRGSHFSFCASEP